MMSLRGSKEGAGTIELKGFNRTLAEIEWLLLVLILVYMTLPDEPIDRPLYILTAGALFAAFVVGFRYANLFTLPTRWKLTIETWAMLGLTAVAVWNTGKVDSPLMNLFLLVVIFSALTLGKVITLLELGLVTSFYLLAAHAVSGNEIFNYEIFSSLMLRFAPFVLVAYVTSLLAADLGFARAYVEQLADTDELTGLRNMRAFNEALVQQEQRARRHDEPLSVLMIDIDNLKTVNDHHGHDTGNLAIRNVAAAIKASVRANDVVARYGGDEFIVLLPSVPELAARNAGERILHRIAEHPIQGPKGSVGLSVSIGLATFPVMAGEVEELLHQADQALYESKRTGRNRLSIYGSRQAA
ncbi:MAG: diguanylate cyclase [Thiohalocapsa sp.]|uniref:GGDEF domain-containing protein n=1 Tax=Thiohalocapsa sp. TaxID=2497641 RepID=UPI0025F137A6|nr:sensor domain-containing diguanylate cyclase [Thiohalocapsa sp.]MCG6940357.1 diguanylate cyclase [Thiohalocapsa sp.]